MSTLVTIIAAVSAAVALSVAVVALAGVTHHAGENEWLTRKQAAAMFLTLLWVLFMLAFRLGAFLYRP